MRKVVVTAVALILIAGAVRYWLVAQSFQPPTVPPTVAAAEDALALPEMFGLMHLNVEYAVSVERTILGPEDVDALLAPGDGEPSLRANLQQEGVDIRESLDHMVAGVFLADGTAGLAAILLGDFPVDTLLEVLPRHYQVEPATIGQADGYLLTSQDIDTCEVSEPVALYVTPHRILVGSPSFVTRVLARIESHSPPAQELGAWRAFREAKVLSLTFLGFPEDLGEALENPFARAATKAAAEELSPVESLYVGASVEAFPPGIQLDSTVHAVSSEWPSETAASFRGWRQELKQDRGKELPTLARLQEHLTVEADGTQLSVGLSLGRRFIEDLGAVVGELIRSAFSSAGLKAQGKTEPQEAERTIPPEQVLTYVPSQSHDDLGPFDETQNPSYEAGVPSGPFGMRIKALRVVEEDPGVVEIEVEAASSEIQNIEIDTMHQAKEHSRVQLLVTQVRGRDGANLLREEPCGKDRNGLGAELRPVPRSTYVDGKWIQYSAVSGSKTVRLKQGVVLSDVKSLEGFVRLRLPTRTEVHRVKTPFDGEVVETDQVRVKFAAGSPQEVKYELSGQVDRTLAIRAQNDAGEYLAHAGSLGSQRFLGRGKTIAKKFRGNPSTAEVVIVTEEVVREYPFQLTPIEPEFGRWEFPKPYRVTESSRAEFQRQSGRADDEAACGAEEPTTVVGPFALCSPSVQTLWGGRVWGRFRLLAPKSTALEKNLSAVEVRLESAQSAGPEGEQRTVPIRIHEFVHLEARQGKRYLQDNASLSGEGSDELKDQQIGGVKGRIVLRLPEQLDQFTLDVTELGNEAAHPIGLSARLVEFSSESLHFEIEGPRERIVQFRPLDAQGVGLSTLSPQLEVLEENRWRGSVRVSGRPQKLEIVFASEQDRLEYSFALPVTK